MCLRCHATPYNRLSYTCVSIIPLPSVWFQIDSSELCENWIDLEASSPNSGEDGFQRNLMQLDNANTTTPAIPSATPPVLILAHAPFVATNLQPAGPSSSVCIQEGVTFLRTQENAPSGLPCYAGGQVWWWNAASPSSSGRGTNNSFWKHAQTCRKCPKLPPTAIYSFAFFNASSSPHVKLLIEEERRAAFAQRKGPPAGLWLHLQQRQPFMFMSNSDAYLVSITTSLVQALPPLPADQRDSRQPTKFGVFSYVDTTGKLNFYGLQDSELLNPLLPELQPNTLVSVSILDPQVKVLFCLAIGECVLIFWCLTTHRPRWDLVTLVSRDQFLVLLVMPGAIKASVFGGRCLDLLSVLASPRS